MRRHKKDSDSSSVGEDSFLDTTANLVGILIILVVIVGAKTRIEAEEYTRQLVDEEPSEEVQRTASEVRGIRDSLAKQEMDSRRYELEIRYRKLERDSMLTQLALAKEELEKRLETTDEQKRESIKRQQLIAELETKLEIVADEMGSDTEQPRPTIVLEHLPTPMAKTVFNREMHVQLKNGRITTIPWDRLVEMLKRQIPLTARRQSSRDTLNDSLGPVGGFLMHFTMASVPAGYELDFFELEVLASAPAESLEEALSPTGRMQLELASRDPSETIITVWVYPDSFDTFRELKARLFRAGFLTAARPLPEGQSIGASPQGTRSSAQ